MATDDPIARLRQSLHFALVDNLQDDDVVRFVAALCDYLAAQQQELSTLRARIDALPKPRWYEGDDEPPPTTADTAEPADDRIARIIKQTECAIGAEFHDIDRNALARVLHAEFGKRAPVEPPPPEAEAKCETCGGRRYVCVESILGIATDYAPCPTCVGQLAKANDQPTCGKCGYVIGAVGYFACACGTGKRDAEEPTYPVRIGPPLTFAAAPGSFGVTEGEAGEPEFITEHQMQELRIKLQNAETYGIAMADDNRELRAEAERLRGVNAGRIVDRDNSIAEIREERDQLRAELAAAQRLSTKVLAERDTARSEVAEERELRKKAVDIAAYRLERAEKAEGELAAARAARVAGKRCEYRVLGCSRCGKPCALVGDLIPSDELCPWCRAKDSPGVYAARDEEEFALRASDEMDAAQTALAAARTQCEELQTSLDVSRDWSAERLRRAEKAEERERDALADLGVSSAKRRELERETKELTNALDTSRALCDELRNSYHESQGWVQNWRLKSETAEAALAAARMEADGERWRREKAEKWLDAAMWVVNAAITAREYFRGRVVPRELVPLFNALSNALDKIDSVPAVPESPTL